VTGGREGGLKEGRRPASESHLQKNTSQFVPTQLLCFPLREDPTAVHGLRTVQCVVLSSKHSITCQKEVTDAVPDTAICAGLLPEMVITEHLPMATATSFHPCGTPDGFTTLSDVTFIPFKGDHLNSEV